MQHFINHAALERAAEEAFSGARARYYLMGLLSAAIALATGLALAAIWLGLALLVDEARKALAARLPEKHGEAPRLALDIAASASLSAAPALAWYARGELGAALAVAMLCALFSHAALGAQHRRRYTIAACLPYALLATMFLLEGVAANVAGVVVAALAVSGYVFGISLHHAHRANNARAQDAEWVRQANMRFGEGASVAWEIDYVRGELIGAERLGKLLNRTITYRDIVESACFAAPGDRALVRAALAPANGPMRRVSVEHALSGDDHRRVRHDGMIRTAPDGTPLRLTCITTPAETAANSAEDVLREALMHAEQALQAQSRSLAVLSNELGAAARSTPEHAPVAPEFGADLYAALTHKLALINQRRTLIADSIADLARARHEAEAANLAKSQFLANMSHELRTPLNAVIGYAEMLQEDSDDRGDAAATQDLGRILSAARHLLGLINEVLDLSKIEAGRIDVSASTFDPADMLEDLIDTMRPLAIQNGNVIRLAGGSPAGLANTDAAKVRQCVLNLLSNACKFTRNGTIDVTLDRRVRHGAADLVIRVRDTGIGMSPEHMSRLFQPFVQADPSITQRFGGTGLGLTITRRLTQLMGGDVSVESVLGEGACFTLTLPADFIATAAAPHAATQVDDIQGAQDAPLVIVIEDEPDARELAARALTRAGFAVQGVGGGEAGLALARAKAPALVLLDIFLPDRSGWRVLQSLKHDPKTQDIPVIVLSVNEDRAHAMSLGAAEHIVKPADRDRLAAAVMRFARKRPDAALNAAAPLDKKQAS